MPDTVPDTDPGKEIDPLIRPIVNLLNSNGYKTFGSCQGGAGHMFSLPTINIEKPDMTMKGRRDARVDLAGLLTGVGLTGFYIKQIAPYQTSAWPKGKEFVQIEFWASIEQLLADSKSKLGVR